jgi:uncharacterized surface protein with fasciclin (FAS1) repeats
LFDAATRAGSFKNFLAAATKTGLVDTLQRGGSFTLFAPTDDAFGRFPSSTMSKLMAADKAALLTSILAYHLALGASMFSQLVGKRFRTKTLEGRELRIDGVHLGGGVTVNGASIVSADISSSNGVLHGIDRVLWPRFAREAVDAEV